MKHLRYISDNFCFGRNFIIESQNKWSHLHYERAHIFWNDKATIVDLSPDGLQHNVSNEIQTP